MIQGFGTFTGAAGESRLGFRFGDAVVDVAAGGLDALLPQGRRGVGPCD